MDPTLLNVAVIYNGGSLPTHQLGCIPPAFWNLSIGPCFGACPYGHKGARTGTNLKWPLLAQYLPNQSKWGVKWKLIKCSLVICHQMLAADASSCMSRQICGGLASTSICFPHSSPAWGWRRWEGGRKMSSLMPSVGSDFFGRPGRAALVSRVWRLLDRW